MEQDVIENHPVKEKEKSAKDTLTWIVNSVFPHAIFTNHVIMIHNVTGTVTVDCRDL